MKRILVTTLILGAVIATNAQSPMKFSVLLDPQFAWLSSDEGSIDPDGSILQLGASLQMDYFFDKNYAFTLGFGINNLGGNLLYADSTEFISKGESIFVTPGQSAKLKLQYLDIPLGLKLKTEELGYGTFFFELGFNPMININASVTTDDESLYKENIKESINAFCLAYYAGAGIEYRLGGSTAAIGGIRWTSGLTDVTDNDRANIKINALSIHLGILF